MKQAIRLLVCLLAGHRPGGTLYRYRSTNHQWPHLRRLSTRLEATGFECSRCGARKETA